MLQYEARSSMAQGGSTVQREHNKYLWIFQIGCGIIITDGPINVWNVH